MTTATALAAEYAQGSLSPVEATQAALEQARESERRWRSGEQLSPIDGVPTSIKDVFLTKGWPTLRGSLCIDPDQPWDVDSPVMARMREAGLVVLGKVTTPELGWKATTDSRLCGITRNPHDPSKTSGGSSGGSAAAVAADMGVLSVGTDAGGSVRIPASFCGIVGFKPTHGRIPLYPASPFGALAHAGPFARTVDDAALLMDVLAQPDHRDPTSPPPMTETFAETVVRDVRGLKAAFSATLGYVDVDPEIADVVATAVEAIRESGVAVEDTDPGFADPADAFEVLWAAGAAKALSVFGDGAREKVDPGLGKIWDHGKTLSALDYLTANETRAALGIHMGEFHTRYDVLITPQMPVRPFEAGHDVPPGGPYTKWWQWTGFTYPFNLTQQPAISIPVGRTSDGLPVGLQIVGPRHADDTVLAFARHVEQVLAG